MNKESIKITIEGQTGSGKTTLALFLKEFLENQGFNNLIIDDFDLSYMDVALNYPSKEKVAAIKDRNILIETVKNSNIVIETAQLKRA